VRPGPGAQSHAKDSARVQALNGIARRHLGQALNGIQDGSHTQALNGLKDQARRGSSKDPLASWIASDPTLQSERLELAHYVVQCAMPPGDDRTVTVGWQDAYVSRCFRSSSCLGQRRANDECGESGARSLLGRARESARCPCADLDSRGPAFESTQVRPELFPVREGAFFALPNGDRRSHDLTPAPPNMFHTRATTAGFAPSPVVAARSLVSVRVHGSAKLTMKAISGAHVVE